jgi:H+/Cl- antiporter ClcA
VHHEAGDGDADDRRAHHNAPIAGAVFVLEELVQRFEHRIAIAALAASATAIGLARVLLGDAPDFHVNALGYGDAAMRPIDFAFGALAGFSAVAYNRALLATRAAAQRLARVPVELRAALVGAAIATLGWFAPGLVGGGDAITQGVLAGGVALAAIPAAFLVRFALGAVSYAAGTPGGLFAPLGAQVGFLSGGLCRSLLPHLDVQSGGACGRRHGGLLHRRCASPHHRHRARHGDDRERHDAAADVVRMRGSHADGDASERSADLRVAARARIASR